MLTTRAPGWSILIRLLVGLVVFFPEGYQQLHMDFGFTALPDFA